MNFKELYFVRWLLQVCGERTSCAWAPYLPWFTHPHKPATTSVRNIMISLMALTGLVFSLSACQEKKSDSYYFTHPSELRNVVLQCQADNRVNDAQCTQAYHVATQLTKLTRAFVANQAEFGQRILRAQIRAAELTDQLVMAKKEHLPTAELQQQLTAAEQRVINLRAVVAMFIQV